MKPGINYPGISVVYFCHDGKGNFVMAKRSKHARDEHGKWDIGAGALDHGVSVEETLRKEIQEEYCTDVKDFAFLGYRDVQRRHEGKLTHWVALDFTVLIDPKQLANGEPHKFDDVKLFTFETMPKPEEVHSQLPHFLELYEEQLH